MTTQAARDGDSWVVPAKDFRDAKIGDLDVTVVSHEDVLELDVAMCDSMVMEMADPAQDLLEDAVSIFGLEVLPFHEAEQLALLAVFHDMIPAAVVRAESDCPDDIGMVERLGNGIFGFDLADVFFLSFPRRLFAKLFDGVNGCVVALLVSFAKHDLDRGTRAFSDFLLPAKLRQRRELGFQRTDVYHKVI